jgi:hypothetical protein
METASSNWENEFSLLEVKLTRLKNITRTQTNGQKLTSKYLNQNITLMLWLFPLHFLATSLEAVWE